MDEPSSGLMSIALLLLVLLVPVAFLGLLFLLLRAAARIRRPEKTVVDCPSHDPMATLRRSRRARRLRANHRTQLSRWKSLAT